MTRRELLLHARIDETVVGSRLVGIGGGGISKKQARQQGTKVIR